MLTMVWLALVLPTWQASPEVKVGVLIRNVSDASERILQKAEDECQRAFLDFGIRITWMHPSADITWVGPDTVLRAAVVPRAPRSRDMEVFGSAVPNKKEGIQVYVYYERVIALSRQHEFPVHMVLALALTHEVGHVLLGSTEHTAAGVMRRVWGKPELDEIARGRLWFTPEQRQRMRSNVLTSAASKR